ncbi:hypothetical protein KL920_001479 [Ogataea angusta]|nr:hypothetical protein KL920_001479 [Ogataea angusta]
MLLRSWLSGLVFTGLAACFQSYCKCDCEVNYEILELDIAHGCSQCTVQYCLEQKIDMCRDPENRELMTAYCFRKYRELDPQS